MRKIIYSEMRRADLAEKILLKIIDWKTIPPSEMPEYAIRMTDLLIEKLNENVK